MDRRSFFKTAGLSALFLQIAPSLFLPKLIKPQWKPPKLSVKFLNGQLLSCERHWRQERISDPDGFDAGFAVTLPGEIVLTLTGNAPAGLCPGDVIELAGQRMVLATITDNPRLNEFSVRALELAGPRG